MEVAYNNTMECKIQALFLKEHRQKEMKKYYTNFYIDFKTSEKKKKKKMLELK